jgi:HEAT repeat protein
MDSKPSARIIQYRVREPLPSQLRDQRQYLETLGKSGDARAIAPLCQALKSGTELPLRNTAASALARIGAPAVLSLCEALQDPEKEVRWRAAWVLGQIGDAGAVLPLCQGLRDASWRVRLEAAEALGRLGDSRAVLPLIEALKLPGWETRTQVARALGKLGDARATGPLCQALREGDEGVRWRAAMLLGQFGDAPAVLPLCEALQDRAWPVRSMAVEALGRIGDARAALPLIELLKHPDWGTRGQAEVALQEIGASAVPSLCQAFKEESYRVRSQAAAILGKIGDARAILPLCEALRQGQVEAAAALGEIALREPVTELLAAVPLLRQRLQAMGFFDSTQTQRTLRLALQRIEKAVSATRHLPIPASAPLPAVEQLPLPAAPPTLAPDGLPVPAAAAAARAAAADRELPSHLARETVWRSGWQRLERALRWIQRWQ